MRAVSRLFKTSTVPKRDPKTRITKGTLSPPRTVPGHIDRPSYVTTGAPPPAGEVYIFKNPDEVHRMREAARLARRMLDFALNLAAPGVPTDYIDERTHEEIVKNGAYPSPLQYCGFPKSICTSINEVACHGIPDSRPLERGDVLKIDVSLFLKGFHGDNCGCVVVGEDLNHKNSIMQATFDSLQQSIDICGPGVCLTKIGETIENHSNSCGFDVVDRFCGHGLGKELHMAPTVLHFSNREKMPLVPGMIFTIEPILAEGSGDVAIWPDQWTIVTKDYSWAAQYEHEVLITKHGHEVLTLPN